MAWPNRSAGNKVPPRAAGFHHSNEATMARLDAALIQNGATMPYAVIVTPPSAGPSARETLTPTLLAAIAGGRSSLGTSCGTTACQAGTVSAPAAPMTNVDTSRLTGVARPRPTTTA